MEEIAEFEIFENDVEEQHAEKCNSKVSCWVGTWNNPSMSDEEFEKFLQDLEDKNYLQYAIFQREQGEETGTIHFQFFVHFKNARYFTWVKKTLPYGCHFKPMRSTQDHCKNYCSKEDTRVSGPYEIGNFSSQGKRSDLYKAMEMLDEGIPFSEVSKIFKSQCLMYGRQLKEYEQKLINEKCSLGPRDVKVTYLYGPPGCGKTTYMRAVLGYKDVFCVDEYDNSMFTNYDNHKAIVFDEFEGDVEIKRMNRYLDFQPVQLRGLNCLKIGSYTTVWIISNFSPRELYKKIQDEKPVLFQAFYRRLGRIVRMDENGKIHIEKDIYNNIEQLTIENVEQDLIFGDDE